LLSPGEPEGRWRMANNIFGEIDWALLGVQKKNLIDFIDSAEIPPGCRSATIESMQGILHLIDGLQDYAVDEHGLGEYEVFGRSHDCDIDNGNTEPCQECDKEDCPQRSIGG
jgi:hypothetical protein